jgi:hypothetical protein
MADTFATRVGAIWVLLNSLSVAPSMMSLGVGMSTFKEGQVEDNFVATAGLNPV